MPGVVHAFERRGAIGQIYIHPGPAIHEGICTPIWGAPTHESIHRKPRTPVVCVSYPDGERLIALAREGGVRAGLTTWLREGAVPAAGRRDPRHGGSPTNSSSHGHYDSWYVGIGDNATGNAALSSWPCCWAARPSQRRSASWWPALDRRYAGRSPMRIAADRSMSGAWRISTSIARRAGATAYEEVMGWRGSEACPVDCRRRGAQAAASRLPGRDFRSTRSARAPSLL
jgi:hypothetical protein